MDCVRILPVNLKTKLLLASNSPRRRQLLGLGNWKFDVSPSNIDETQLEGESPEDYVLRLAREKALSPLKAAQHGDLIVIGSDTAVVNNRSVLGKPAGREDAARMLKLLRARSHQVYTGLVLRRASDGKTLAELSLTHVSMRNYSDEEIQAYIESGDPFDKAGAYAIQHPQFHPVQSLRGCYASVMGLPLCHLARALRALDVPPLANIPAACRKLLRYECPAAPAILRGETASSSKGYQ